MVSTLITVMEIIGTVSFAISGSIIAVRYGLDLFGVVLTGCVTAVCGGIIRDILLGQFPPAIFSNATLLTIAAATSLAVFITSYFNAKRFYKLEKGIENVNVLFDATGLAAFSVIGVEVSFNSGYGKNALLTVSVGVITGIGGGIVRDILVDKIPYVLKKHIYALASIIGSVIYYIFRLSGNKMAGLLVAVPVMITIRLLAAKYHWKLPRIKIEENCKSSREKLSD